MKKLIALLTVLSLLLIAGLVCAAETRYTNGLGQQVRGNWTSGHIVEITTVEQYYDAVKNPDPAATYQVAPWLYDPANLTAESGGDE